MSPARFLDFLVALNAATSAARGATCLPAVTGGAPFAAFFFFFGAAFLGFRGSFSPPGNVRCPQNAAFFGLDFLALPPTPAATAAIAALVRA